MGDRPVWARRIRAERQARSWSQSDAVRALRATDNHLTGQESLLRQWRRWESGEVEPGNHYKRLIAKTFGLATAILFPPDRPEIDRQLVVGTGMDAAEVVARLRVSDLSVGVLDAMRITADRLCCEYSPRPAEEVHAEAVGWLRRLIALRDGNLTLAQHRELLSLAGQVALLVGCLEYDMGQRASAEVTRRAALSLGEESGDHDVIGWAHEMRAWYALTSGDHRAAIAAADEGLGKVDPAHSVVVQLAAHRAKAWARVGDRRQVELALDRGRSLLEALPYPGNPDNHFVVDPNKWIFYTMDCYRMVGDDRLAAFYADEVVRSSINFDGTVRGPMRLAEARITQAVVLARAGDLESALLHGRQALAGGRRSLPSLTMHAGELVGALRQRFSNDRRVTEFVTELRALVVR